MVCDRHDTGDALSHRRLASLNLLMISQRGAVESREVFLLDEARWALSLTAAVIGYVLDLEDNYRLHRVFLDLAVI